MMGWYAASIIMYTEFKDGVQDKYPVWENIILIEGQSETEAKEKAEKRGREDEGDSDGTYAYEGRPAKWVYAGVRKLISTSDFKNRPADGTEITYSVMEVSDKDSLTKLANGDPVTVKYEE